MDWYEENYISYPFRLVEIITLTFHNQINPYTGKIFSPNITQQLKENYNTQFKLFQLYNDYNNI